MNHLVINNYGIPKIDFSPDIFTIREREVMKRILLPDKNIATDLKVSYHTVQAHKVNIKNKTGLYDKAQLVYYATKTGLIN
ncbi:response regulator transcription factor [Pedobacter sp. AW1-32]|uniref:response regulator transcription factor n=1 Tax=Pedobacter sp. AW1-32 TaxID=3383026 RepID=UPI003FF12871